MSGLRDLTEEGREAVRPTQERLAKGGVIIPLPDRENPQSRPARVEGQTTLDRYKSRKTLDDEQLSAAYRWHAYAMRSNRFPKSTMGWTGPINGSNDDLQDGQVSAGIQRDAGITYLNAININFASIVDYVCVDDHAAESWAIFKKMHPRKGIKTLREALDSLCKHYGIRK